MADIQMDFLIQQAQEAIAEKGAEASDREITLACFGWLGQKFSRLPCLDNCLKPKNDTWKKWVAVGLGIGCGLAGGGTALAKLLGL